MKKNNKIYIIIRIFIFVFLLFSSTKNVFAELTWQYEQATGVQTEICGYLDQGSCNAKLEELYPGKGLKCTLKDTPCNNSYIPISAQQNGAIDDPNNYTLLAPIGDLENIRTNDIGSYFNTIFLIAIGLAGALAVIMIIIAGVQWMGTDSVFGKTEAKKQITGAVLGLLIAIGAYALLNTIDPALLGIKGLTVDQVEIELDPNVYGDIPQQSAVNGYYCEGRAKAGEVWGDDTSERNAVKSAGITIQRSNSCKKVGDQNCTSLAGLNTIKVINFKKTICPNCDVIINGGTECWLHSPGTTHFKGNSIVDLDNTSSLVKYVQKGQQKKVKDTNLYTYERDGIVFLDEGNHYHIISW